MKAGFDFLVIGAQKAGTTALFEYLRRHPRLSLPAGKEVPFYSHDSVWAEGWPAYTQHHFVNVSSDLLWGTVSPQYMIGAPVRPVAPPDDPETVVPRRIAEHSPRVKLVAVLRDPVGRAYSHHQMHLMNGWDARPFSRAVGELLEPEALVGARRSPVETNSYVAFGEYGRILEPFFSLFDRSQILVLFHGDLLAEPGHVLQRVFAFLGVDDTFVPPNLGERYRVGAARRRLGWLNPNAVQARVAEVAPLRALWRQVPVPVRARINGSYQELSYRIDLANRTEADQMSGEDAQTVLARERLRAHYASDGALLRELLGVDLPWPVR